MYLEVSGVSKRELGGMREKLKIKGRGHDARYGMGISWPVRICSFQPRFQPGRKCELNLKLRGGMRDAGCGMRDAGCGMRDAGCGMRDAG